MSGRKGVAAFCLGKGANRILAQSLAREAGPEGIQVTHVVLDGLFDNQRTKDISPGLKDEDFMKQPNVAKIF